MINVLIVGLTALANISIAYIVIRKSSKSATHLLLAFLSLITAGWTIMNFLALSPGPEALRLFWVRAVMFFTTPYGTVIMLLSSVFPDAHLQINKRLLVVLVLYNVGVALLAISPYMFTKLVNLPDGSFSLTPGWAILFYAIGFMGFMTVGFIQLAKKYRSSSGLAKKQLQFFIMGLVVSFSLLTLTNFIAVVVFRSIQLTFLGPPFTLILFASTAYAIIKHRFLDIHYLVVRSISFAIVIVLIVTTYTVAALAMSQILPPSFDRRLIDIVLIVVISFLTQPSARILEKITNRIFYQKRYSPDEFLYRASQIMALTIDLSDLTNKILTEIRTTIQITSVTIIVLDPTKKFIIESQPGVTPHLGLIDEELDILKQYDEPILLEEIPESHEKNIFRKRDIVFFLPLKTKQKTIGYLLLGPKASGDPYLDIDVQTLETLSSSLAVALENSQSYEEIKRFNITLQEEVKKATEKLQEANVHLKELDKLKDEFLSVVSHDLRTPMTAMKGYAWLILKRTQGMPEDIVEKMRRIYNSTERMIALINDILDLSRIESGRMQMVFETFDMGGLIRDVVEELSGQAADHNVSIQSEEIGSYKVRADRNRTHEVLVNLIGNAIKFTPKGGTITLSCQEEDDSVATSVRDTGIGIDKKEFNNLFVKFGRIDTSSNPSITQVPGTGLGLFICKKIVELSNGNITVESEVGKGSTFVFTLPKG